MVCNICGNKIIKNTLKCTKCNNYIDNFNLCSGYCTHIKFSVDKEGGSNDPLTSVLESKGIVYKSHNNEKIRGYKDKALMITLASFAMTAIILILVLSFKETIRKDVYYENEIAIEQTSDYLNNQRHESLHTGFDHFIKKIRRNINTYKKKHEINCFFDYIMRRN